MKGTIYPAIWFRNAAKEAFQDYVSIFPDSQIIESNAVVISTKLNGVPFIGINGGPYFTPNPAISFMVICETEEEIDRLWEMFLDDGEVLVPLDNYAWSPYYGWINDKNKVSWQLYLGSLEEVNNQVIVPTLLFCGPQQGKCEEAIAFYKSVFRDFTEQSSISYPDGDRQGQILQAQFVVNGFTFIAADNPDSKPFSFNEALSLVIPCEDQKEIDYYWAAMTKNGEESRCGWCKDPFGVSWQIVPHNIDELLRLNPAANKSLMRMNKINIADLIN
ncbi:VOC family protein [Sphingobacterium paludis]|uniref:Putative 3-demethylubiquinone-9 3-methyltransferase (Glyoxalase superfamily) n=1 Tax=Sphingobacterium paludis TaxID=1476465 RepID=A0A4R7CUV2_9SPHI|nr:VOC family protein [Sphingobacterium paludis]TDS11930.1 putative 3-demethylubiquinone-9 3-methyltransferase (glyoxalase superfamily) [Sphingobacterium paludis]